MKQGKATILEPMLLENPACRLLRVAEDASIVPDMPLMDFLGALVRWRPRPAGPRVSMLSQVFIRLAQQVEKRLLRATASAEAGRPADTGIEVDTFDWQTASADEASVQLTKYRQAQKRLLANQKYIGLACDKSRVLGLSLLSTCVSLPNKQACWLFPVVWTLFAVGSRQAAASSNRPNRNHQQAKTTNKPTTSQQQQPPTGQPKHAA